MDAVKAFNAEVNTIKSVKLGWPIAYTQFLLFYQQYYPYVVCFAAFVFVRSKTANIKSENDCFNKRCN